MANKGEFFFEEERVNYWIRYRKILNIDEATAYVNNFCDGEVIA